MNEIQQIVVQSLHATMILAIVYGCIYYIEKSKLFLIWTLSWILYALQYVMHLLSLSYSSIFYEWLAQVFWIASSYLLIVGGSIYIGKSIHWSWKVMGIFNLAWLVFALLSDTSFFWLVLPNSIFIGVTFFWLGTIYFIKKKYVIAGLFCIWGIHKMDYPFLQTVEWFEPWSYHITEMLTLSVAIGVLIEYMSYSKLRTEEIKRRYKTLVDYSEDIIFSFDTEYSFLSVNNKLCEVLKKNENKIVGKKIFELPLFNQLKNDFIRLTNDTNKENKMMRCEKEVVYKDHTYNYQIDIAPIEDQQLVCTMHNISELRDKEKTIRNLAYYDQLTGLPNRHLFNEHFNMRLKGSKQKEKIALIMIDIYNFKKINDAMGHKFGDLLITSVAHRLKDNCNRYFLFRFSGDKYGLLVDQYETNEMLLQTVFNIFKCFNQPITINEQSYYVQLTLGIEEDYASNLSLEDMLMNADTALNKAKEIGPNRYYFYNIALKNEIIKKLNIEKQLRKAIEEDTLEIYYQPLVDLEDNRIKKIEALLRWKPQNGQGIIMPNDFIPVAESSLLIIDIGYWVIQQVCIKLKEWERQGIDICVAVNISVRQLEQNDFVENVSNILKNMHVSPKNIEFEITESIFIDSLDTAVERINRLREIGIKISLDDFGTYYSSLNYLRKLPCDTIKIDKTFIDDMDHVEAVAFIVKTIIDIAHHLDMQVVAEGVDTKEKCLTLMKMNCDLVQGYLFGKPVRDQEIVEALQSKNK